MEVSTDNLNLFLKLLISPFHVLQSALVIDLVEFLGVFRTAV